MATAKDSRSTIAYYGDVNSTMKHALFAIDFAAASQGLDGAKWASVPQSTIIIDLTKPIWAGNK